MIVINVNYLNKWSYHYVKLLDRAKSGPLKSLYAATDAVQYNVGLMYIYTVQPPIGGISEVIFILTQFSLWCILVSGGSFSIDSFHNCYPISVRTDCGFSAVVTCDCRPGVCCDMCDCGPSVCCYMCECWPGVCCYKCDCWPSVCCDMRDCWPVVCCYICDCWPGVCWDMSDCWPGVCCDMFDCWPGVCCDLCDCWPGVCGDVCDCWPGVFLFLV